jgi:hypothetical protein
MNENKSTSQTNNWVLDVSKPSERAAAMAALAWKFGKVSETKVKKGTK